VTHYLKCVSRFIWLFINLCNLLVVHLTNYTCRLEVGCSKKLGEGYM